jgi:hypothetical protein
MGSDHSKITQITKWIRWTGKLDCENIVRKSFQNYNLITNFK